MASSKRKLSIILAPVILIILPSLLLLMYSNKHWGNVAEQFRHALCVPEPSWYTEAPINRAFHPIDLLEKTSESHSGLNNQMEQTWESLLLPPNGGLLRVKQGNGTTAQYGVSMFHQLHCLIVLRGLLFPGTSQNHEHSTSPSKTGEPHQDSVHWAHCLDHIAQGILCAADDTIEPSRRVKNEHGGHTVVVDGVGHTHQCRDPVPLWRAVMNSETDPVDLGESRKGEGLRTLLKDKSIGDLQGMPIPYRPS